MSEQPEFLKLEELKEKIRFHMHRYYVVNDPLISDQEFDQLLLELRSIEEAHPEWISSDSPTQRIETSISDKFSKVEHIVPVLSLANAFDVDDLKAWYTRILKIDDRVSSAGYSVEPKLDGLTVVLHYQNGILVQGATRGNGIVGEDITTNLRTLNSIPLKIPVSPSLLTFPADIYVRGEVFIDLDDFQKLNETLELAGERTYQTPRNTAAGALRQLDPKIAATRPLRILCYTILQSSDPLPNTQVERLEYLKGLGFPVPEDSEFAENIDDAAAICEAWIDKRDKLAYEIDGVVVKLNELDLADDISGLVIGLG
jgi:DNA ligase (NAD+)